MQAIRSILGVCVTLACVADGTAQFIQLTRVTQAMDPTLPTETVTVDVLVDFAGVGTFGAGVLCGRTFGNVTLRYAPNPEGGVCLSAPANCGPLMRHVTFVSEPLGQFDVARFAEGVAFAGAGCPAGPTPIAEPQHVDAAYFAVPPSTVVIGYTQRVSLDLSATTFLPGDAYVSTTGPDNPFAHFTLFEGTSMLAAAGGPLASLDWGVYAPLPITNHFGVPHVPLGVATLAVERGNLIVSNISDSGEDGVSSGGDHAWGSYRLIFPTIRESTMRLTPFGRFEGNSNPEEMIGTLVILNSAAFTPGSAHFIAGPRLDEEQEIQIFDDGRLVATFGRLIDPQLTFDAAPERFGFESADGFVASVAWAADTDIQVDGGPRIRGDEVHIHDDGPEESITFVYGKLGVTASGTEEFSISHMGFLPSCPGDLDGDFTVALPDLARLLANFGRQGGVLYVEGDLNVDDVIDLTDLAFELTQFGQRCE